MKRFTTSLPTEENVLFDAPDIRTVKVLEAYSFFTVEPLHFLHLDISNTLKECTMSYLSSEIIAVKYKERALRCWMMGTFKPEFLRVVIIY